MIGFTCPGLQSRQGLVLPTRLAPASSQCPLSAGSHAGVSGTGESAKPAARTAAGVGSPRRGGAGGGSRWAPRGPEARQSRRARSSRFRGGCVWFSAKGLRGPVGGTHRSLGPEPPEPHGAQVSLAAPEAPARSAGRPRRVRAAAISGLRRRRRRACWASGRCPGGAATPRRGLGPRGRWGGRSGRLAETRPLAGRRPGGAAVCSCPARPWSPRLRPLPDYKFIICRSRKSGADVTGKETQEPNLAAGEHRTVLPTMASGDDSPIFEDDESPPYSLEKMTDLVAVWEVALSDGVHKIEFEHGTTSGKRVVYVDGKEEIRKEWMFKLVGKETFCVGAAKTKATISIDPVRAFAYEYTLEINGKSLKKYMENRSKTTSTWVLHLDSEDFRVVLEKDTMDVWCNGKKMETAGEFVDDGTETHFNIGNHDCYIKAVSSGKRKEGIIHSLIVDNREIPEILK